MNQPVGKSERRRKGWWWGGGGGGWRSEDKVTFT